MGWPQIVYIALTCVGLGISLVEHGKPKTGYYNFGLTLVSTGIVYVVLWWGHFFG